MNVQKEKTGPLKYTSRKCATCAPRHPQRPTSHLRGPWLTWQTRFGRSVWSMIWSFSSDPLRNVRFARSSGDEKKHVHIWQGKNEMEMFGFAWKTQKMRNFRQLIIVHGFLAKRWQIPCDGFLNFRGSKVMVGLILYMVNSGWELGAPPWLDTMWHHFHG